MDAVTGAAIAIVTFLATSAVQIWRDHAAEQRAIAAEVRADRRLQRDAKLARMRKAFEPVLIAAGGLQTAAAQYFYSASGNPDADSQTILQTSMAGINEARAQLWLEEGIDDVAAQLERVFRAFETIRFEIGGRVAGRGSAVSADDLKNAFEDVRDGAAEIRRLVADHMRAMERSA